MIDYPLTLPRPDTEGYSGVVDSGLAITPFPTARPNITKVFNSPRVDLSVTFTMTNNVYADDWFPWIIANAYDWFNMQIINPNTPTDITSLQRVRFTSPLQYRKNGDNWLSITVALEMVMGDL